MPWPERGALAGCVRTLVATRCGAAWRADLGEGVALNFGEAPIARVPETASRSAVPGCHAQVTAAGGRIGVDVETLPRVALNAMVDDPWLAPGERRTVAAAADPLVELACRWVLKEAYGKALGVGLALSLDTLAFYGCDGRIIADGAATKGWHFALYRRCDMIFAVARQPMPFAPVGRNPPAPPLDRYSAFKT